MNARFFVVKYRAGDPGCPPYLSGELNRAEWEWPMYVADPFGVDVKHEYIFTLSDPSISIDFDFYGTQTNYVSKEFLAACEKLGVRYRVVPLVSLRVESRRVIRRIQFSCRQIMSLCLIDKSRTIPRTGIWKQKRSPRISCFQGLQCIVGSKPSFRATTVLAIFLDVPKQWSWYVVRSLSRKWSDAH